MLEPRPQSPAGGSLASLLPGPRPQPEERESTAALTPSDTPHREAERAQGGALETRVHRGESGSGASQLTDRQPARPSSLPAPPGQSLTRGLTACSWGLPNEERLTSGYISAGMRLSH